MNGVKFDSAFDFDRYFELSPDLLCIIGVDGYFKKINTSVSRTLGYTIEELLASPIDSFIHPDDQNIPAQKRLAIENGAVQVDFENRFVAKNGSIIWLSWTTMPIERDQLVFAIAVNTTDRKQQEELQRITDVLKMINDDHKNRFNKTLKEILPKPLIDSAHSKSGIKKKEPSMPDQAWLHRFETTVRKHGGERDLTLTIIADELAIGERQLFRRVDQILGITPNKLVRKIRLQIAWEAIASGKYRTITEIANIAGFGSRAHFSKLFREAYGIHIAELL